jgi:uncharacterized protein YcfJ
MAFDPSTAQLDGFDPSTAKPVESRGALAEIGTAAVRGLYTGVKGAGAIMQAPAEIGRSEPGIVSRAGKATSKNSARPARSATRAARARTAAVTNFLGELRSSIGGSLPVVAGAMVGGAAGSPCCRARATSLGAAAGGAARPGCRRITRSIRKASRRAWRRNSLVTMPASRRRCQRPLWVP